MAADGPAGGAAGGAAGVREHGVVSGDPSRGDAGVLGVAGGPEGADRAGICVGGCCWPAVHGNGGALVLVSPAPVMTDARVDKSTPLGHPWSQVAQRSSWDASSRVLTDALVPGRGWLSAAGRAWPVTVDPTITIAPVPCQAYNPDNPVGCAHNVMISSD